jgi:hypothetical protein
MGAHNRVEKDSFAAINSYNERTWPPMAEHNCVDKFITGIWPDLASAIPLNPAKFWFGMGVFPAIPLNPDKSQKIRVWHDGFSRGMFGYNQNTNPHITGHS